MNTRRLAFVLAILAIVILSNVRSPDVARAADFTVTTGADAVDANPGNGVCATATASCTLRAAIQETNALPGTQTVDLPARLYSLTIPGSNEELGATGDLDIRDSVTIVGGGADDTIIAQTVSDRVLHVGPGGMSISVSLSGVTIRDGDAGGYGGGGIRNEGSLNLFDSFVTANTAASNGGGVNNTADMTITGSTIYSNTTSINGGGIANIGSGGNLAVTNSTLSGNGANGQGGGILNNNGSVNFVNATLALNRADDDVSGAGDGGGIAVVGGTVSSENTILATNIDESPSAEAPDCSGTINSLGYNLVGNSSGCTLAGTTTGNIVPGDARLGPLAGNGSDQPSHALLGGSQAIDSGTNLCPSTDQRGVARPIDADANGSATCDIGAYEVAPSSFCGQSWEEPNESFAAAEPASASRVYQACINTSIDNDYFVTSVGAEVADALRVEVINPPANYDLAVYGPSQTLVGESKNPGTSSEMVEIPVSQFGAYYARVSGVGGAFSSSAPYYLKITLVDDQMEDLLRLRQDSLTTPEVVFENAVPRLADVKVSIPPSLRSDPVDAALDYLNTYPSLYNLDDPSAELVPTRILAEDATDRGVFFQQVSDGVPVWGAELAVHMDGQDILLTNGNYLAEVPVFDQPAIEKDDAEATALTVVDGSQLDVTGDTRLMLFNPTLISGNVSDDSTHLAWRVEVAGYRSSGGSPTVWTVFIDAFDSVPLLSFDEAPGDSPDKDFDIESVYNHAPSSETCWAFSSIDDEWFDEDGPTGYPGASADAFLDAQHAFDFAHATYNYYFNTFHRHSYDGDEEDVEVITHVLVDNAEYQPWCDNFNFNNGWGAKDVFAHEFTHGVTASTANLTYLNESGALNESYSDVFGQAVDNDEWLNGEDVGILTEDAVAGVVPPIAPPSGYPGGPDYICFDGIDNDLDGVVDDLCPEVNAGCDNGLDDDADGVADDGCWEFGSECDNGVDEDGDGTADDGCPETGAECGNAADNDGDGFPDEGCPGSCTDGLDNGMNGRSDRFDVNTCVLRDLSDPPRKGDPDTYLGAYWKSTAAGASDNGGVHSNSGVSNKIAFLISEGGIHNGKYISGIGANKMHLLYYKVLTRRLIETSRYADQRRLTVWQAQKFVRDGVVTNGSPWSTADVCQVINAFFAAGIGSEDINCDGVVDVLDVDTDSDTFVDSEDNCPNIANPNQYDIDHDGVGDACDPDSDNDGICDPGKIGAACNGSDNCPRAYNPGQQDSVHPGNGGDACSDPDFDGICDSGPAGPIYGPSSCHPSASGSDNCPNAANILQEDADSDGTGDQCEIDTDNDGICDPGHSGVGCTGSDNCPDVANAGQQDSDGDGIGNGCDLCPGVAGGIADNDADGFGDSCDGDDDNDRVCDTGGPLPAGSGVPAGGCTAGPSGVDNCQTVSNPDQIDIAFPGLGLACDSNEILVLSGEPQHVISGPIRFVDTQTPILIPITLCVADGCPDHLQGNTRVNVSTTLPFSDMGARVVDDRHFSIRSSRTGSATRSLSFLSASDAFFSASSGMLSAQIQQAGGGYVGSRYYLQVFPSPQVVPGQTYTLTVGVQTVCSTAPVWSVPADDSDCDGYPDTDKTSGRAGEGFIGTNPASACPATATSNDEPLPDAWPMDLDDNQKVTILDVSRFSPVFGKVGPAPPYSVRFDFNGDGKITILDIAQFSSFFGKVCSP